MATDAAVAPRRVFAAAVGAGRLATLVHVCADPVEQSVAGLTGDAAVRALTVDALLTGTLQRVLTLIHVCAGVAAEPVTKATHTPVAARRVVAATVAAGILLTLVDVLTAGLLAVAPVPGRTHTPVAPHGVHTLSSRTHTWRLHTLIHVLAERALRVGLVSLITHTRVSSTGLIDAAAAPTHTWSALTHTSHRCLDSCRRASAGPRLGLGTLGLDAGGEGVPPACRLLGPGLRGGPTTCLTPGGRRLRSGL